MQSIIQIKGIKRGVYYVESIIVDCIYRDTPCIDSAGLFEQAEAERAAKALNAQYNANG